MTAVVYLRSIAVLAAVWHLARKFQDKEAKDIRGLPVWEMDRWRDRA